MSNIIFNDYTESTTGWVTCYNTYSAVQTSVSSSRNVVLSHDFCLSLFSCIVQSFS